MALAKEEGNIARASVAFDARLMTTGLPATGVGVYVSELVRHLRQRGEDVWLLADRAGGDGLLDVKVVRKWPGLPWQQTALVWRLARIRPAVYHSPAFSVPLWAPVPTVVTVHDLSFVRYPAYATAETRRYLEAMVPRAIAAADRVITISGFVARELREYYGLSDRLAQKLRPIALGVAPWWTPAPASMVRERTGSWGPDYFVFVGSREPRKNLVRVAEAILTARARHGIPHRLVLAGPPGWKNEPLTRLLDAHPDVLIVLPYVSREDLLWLVRGASAMVYMSEYEGFGLPVLEAMAAGTPVLTSRGTVMEEIAGGHAALADPHDVDDMAEKLAALAEDSEERRRLADEGLRWAARYTWEETARLTCEVYDELRGR